ncbi:uncharacterized protein PITG_07536 [Phytophthora infestans T30-4]|uniref:Expansin-like EG45 domain-containing protein n=2 Tax=Phytophthora infestans TaxID=4787 RepID=D0N8K8_PHYIT|nr:uncharacterized protein PITG_07536 [Phytophthora infestans T30-4]EEY53893.1 conserved hypothetical protein [Phytophthora infestans T30-4]KAF4035275.1 hypothetical protein GN244_ATG12681 [Phytophthora infestans]|eukprot:XP_002904524.1 conserved hypothetical protein [Phytophthora infestans T30-4]
MMLRQISLLAALPAVALAGGANDIYFTGDGTANAVGKATAATCGASVGDNYVAINSDQWNSTQNCKKCIEVSCDDDRCSDQTNTVVVYVAGECIDCEDEGVDLSPTVFKKLTGSDPSRFTIKWEFTECPNSFNALKGSDAYQAGKVEPADEKQSKVSILQTNEEGVENNKDNSETQQTNNKSGTDDVSHGGTSPVIVALIVVGSVCGIALAAVFYTAKKKGNKRDECLTKSFDTFSSPAQKKKKAAIVTI